MDSILKNMILIKKKFHALKIIITGKLRGGTARTSSYSVGFGNFPKQSLSENIRYEFGNIESKYGSFGVKILT
jgi:ribosomal protein S3